jgi:hypothetical protein
VLVLVNAALAAGLVAVAVAALLPPDDVRAPAVQRRGAAPSSDTEDRIGSLESYAGVWQRPLRSPLFDAPPPKETPKPTPPPPTFRLVFTAVEPGASMATFRTAGGELRTISVGESIDGAVLLEVTRTTATVQAAGQKYTLTREGGS